MSTSVHGLIVVLFLMISLEDIICEFCEDDLKKINSIDTFIKFYDLMKQRKPGLALNDCLNVREGATEDLAEMRQVVDDRNQYKGGICQSSYVDRLIQLYENMESHKHNHPLASNKHGLKSFYKDFVGRVIKTCKRSLVNKISELAYSSEFFKNLDKLSEAWGKNIKKYDSSRSGSFSSMLRPAIKRITSGSKLEDLILVDELERTSGAAFLIFVQVPNEKKMKEIEELRQACKVIDSYAENSIKPIARLAMHGFIETTSDYIPTDWRETFNKWLVSEQLCQGIMIARPIIAGARISEEIKEMTNQIGSETIKITITNKEIKRARYMKQEEADRKHKYKSINQDNFDDKYQLLNRLVSMQPKARLSNRMAPHDHRLIKKTMIRTVTKKESSVESLMSVIEKQVLVSKSFHSSIPYYHGAIILFDAIMNGFSLLIADS